MHTVRNREASKPRSRGKSPPPVRRKKHEPAFLLQTGNPPAFPPGLIVPPPRGAVIATIAWPEPAAPAPHTPAKPITRRKPASRKARKPSAKSASKTRTAAKLAPKPVGTARPSLAKDETAPMMTDDLLGRALAMKPQRLADAVPIPEMRPQSEDPIVAAIPRSRALAPARSHALLDIVGHWLRDAGTWIAGLSKARRNAEERARIARANARHHALQSQLEALEALREVARADALQGIETI